jgi:hypothetical protein
VGKCVDKWVRVRTVPLSPFLHTLLSIPVTVFSVSICRTTRDALPRADTRSHAHTHTCALVSPPTAQQRCMPPARVSSGGARVAVTPLAPLSPNRPRSPGKMSSSGKKPAKVARVSNVSAISNVEVCLAFSPQHTHAHAPSITSKALCWCCVLHHLDAASRRRLVQRSRFSSHVNGSVCARTRVVVSSSSPSSSHHVTQFSCA